MESLTIILLIAIVVFAIGNILLFFLEKKQKKRIIFGNANTEVISSKLDVLNKRISKLEHCDETIKEKPKTKIIKSKKSNETKQEEEKPKTMYPITRYKRKKKK